MPGYFEVDLVADCGGLMAESFGPAPMAFLGLDTDSDKLPSGNVSR